MGTTTSDELQAFRAALYACFGRRRDALFELVEGLLTTADAATPTSVARLSLAPSHRRGWGSAYAALRRGEVDEDALRALLAWHFAGGASRPPKAPAYGHEFAVD